VTALVGGLALVLPPLAARWNHGYGWPELTAVAAVGAAAGCVTVAAVATAQHGRRWPLPGERVMWWVAAAVLGAALFAGVAYLANRRR
jgi:hypothetical protein